MAPRTVRRRADAMLAALGLEHAELSVVLCDDATIAAHNAAFRGEDRPTDVLSFPLTTEPPAAPLPGGPPVLLGDVFISLPTAARQARDGLGCEVTRLLAHGLLHCVGWDHDTSARRARMDRETDRLVTAASPRR
jgi:probable rRNA maturation factor